MALGTQWISSGKTNSPKRKLSVGSGVGVLNQRCGSGNGFPGFALRLFLAVCHFLVLLPCSGLKDTFEMRDES